MGRTRKIYRVYCESRLVVNPFIQRAPRLSSADRSPSGVSDLVRRYSPKESLLQIHIYRERSGARRTCVRLLLSDDESRGFVGELLVGELMRPSKSLLILVCVYRFILIE